MEMPATTLTTNRIPRAAKQSCGKPHVRIQSKPAAKTRRCRQKIHRLAAPTLPLPPPITNQPSILQDPLRISELYGRKSNGLKQLMRLKSKRELGLEGASHHPHQTHSVVA